MDRNQLFCLIENWKIGGTRCSKGVKYFVLLHAPLKHKNRVNRSISPSPPPWRMMTACLHEIHGNLSWSSCISNENFYTTATCSTAHMALHTNSYWIPSYVNIHSTVASCKLARSLCLLLSTKFSFPFCRNFKMLHFKNPFLALFLTIQNVIFQIYLNFERL